MSDFVIRLDDETGVPVLYEWKFTYTAETGQKTVVLVEVDARCWK
jgi:uncharacterized protein YrzB (UPF0473 family)